MAILSSLCPPWARRVLRTAVGSSLLLAGCAVPAVAETNREVAVAAAPSREEFSFDSVCRVAEQHLAVPFSRKVMDLPCELIGLDYDSWRYIAYHVSKAIWRQDELPFQVETGHRGYLFPQRVDLYEVADQRAKELPFSPHSFEYRSWLRGYRFPRTLGHSGWKLLGKYNDELQAAETSGKEVYVREIASFLGASYFRVLGSQHVYGSSTRGLAVDGAMAHPEEFPVFTKFWLQRPDPTSHSFRCWALLESERVVGAYQFDITPDVTTVVSVKTKLYIRGKIDKLGIAPITSMWMWGGGVVAPEGDPRSEVHDADGLLVVGTDNSRLWRPLSRPSIPIVNHYAVPGLIAFGLVQRNRDPKHYGDNEARYHDRPSILIEPQPAWPAGGVELLRLPARHEGVDNIAAFYLLKEPPLQGESIELDYRIHVCDDDNLTKLTANQAADDSSGQVARFIESHITNPEPGNWKIRLTADARETVLASLGEDKLQPELISLWNEHGTIRHRSVQRDANQVTVSLEVQTDPGVAFELLLRLNDGQRDLTEMWSYRCEP
ncbi:MAG: glucan biosynthesis protein [Planctomycetaceae bacterium]